MKSATLFGLLLGFCVPSTAEAARCRIDRTGPLQLGATYNLNARIKESQFFRYSFRGPYAFHGIQIVKKPPTGSIVARNYEIGGSISQLGRHQLMFRVNAENRTGRRGFFTVIMNIDVVREC